MRKNDVPYNLQVSLHHMILAYVYEWVEDLYII